MAGARLGPLLLVAMLLLLSGGCGSGAGQNVGSPPGSGTIGAPPTIGGTGGATRPPPTNGGTGGATRPPPPTPGAVPTTGTPPLPDSAVRMEELAARELRQGTIAYNPPTAMRLEETARVEVRITRAADPEFGTDLQGKGTPRIEQLPVGTQMRGELRSEDFEVTALRPEVQFLRQEGSRSWLWDITPKETGDLQLSLIVSVVHEGDTLDYTALDRSIKVDVTAAYATGSWFSDNWEKVLGASGLTLVGVGGSILAVLRRRRHPEQNAS